MPVFKLTLLLVMITGSCVLTMCQAHNYCSCCPFTRMLGGTVVYHILQEETDVHIVQVSFSGSQSQHAGSWLDLSPLASESTFLTSHSLNCFSRMFQTLLEKRPALCHAADCAHINRVAPCRSWSTYTKGAEKHAPHSPFPGRCHSAALNECPRLPADTFPLRLNTVHSTSSVTSGARILYISPPPVFYYGVKFPSWAWGKKGGTGNWKCCQNLRAWAWTLDAVFVCSWRIRGGTAKQSSWMHKLQWGGHKAQTQSWGWWSGPGRKQPGDFQFQPFPKGVTLRQPWGGGEEAEIEVR